MLTDDTLAELRRLLGKEQVSAGVSTAAAFEFLQLFKDCCAVCGDDLVWLTAQMVGENKHVALAGPPEEE